ncbi:MAG: tRNA lysidine(34) synthetase TilS [Gammaproteobacteria bacterium]|nr:MAG: tRNA lysidine(34) synthetase TilS [Gammaproteobacteria bacterium]
MVSKGIEIIGQLEQGLATMPECRGYWVAYSGGGDSTALLHAMAHLRPAGKPLRAVHVNHGLQPEAQDWEKHCASVCRALSIPLEVRSADLAAERDTGPEGTARRARYRVLKHVVSDQEVLLTAHTREDQAETVLLQLLRGAGPAGLSAMPVCAPFGAGWHGRPLLRCPRDSVVAFLQAEQASWIEDPSNRDRHFDRNLLRHDVLPLVRRRWPAVDSILARVARHQAEASHLLADVAAADLLTVAGDGAQTLSCESLRVLSLARQKNLLRLWLRRRGLSIPNEAQLERVLNEVVASHGHGTSTVIWGECLVRCYRDQLYADTRPPAHDSSVRQVWNPRDPLNLAHGQLRAVAVRGRGLDAGVCRSSEMSIGFRQGGERLKPAGRQGTHCLKKLFQEKGIPPWERDRVPLVFVAGELAAVAGLWVGDGYLAEADTEGLELVWQPRPASQDDA